MGNQTVANDASGKLAGATHDQRYSPAVVSQVAFHGGEGNAVIGGADHERVVQQTLPFKCVDYLPDSLVHHARARVMSCHVHSRLWRVGDRNRRQDVIGLIGRCWRGIFAVSFLEADIQKKGRMRAGFDEGCSRRRNSRCPLLLRSERRRRKHFVKADRFGFSRDMLQAGQN